MTSFLFVLTTLNPGLLIGTEFAVSVFVNPIVQQLEDPIRRLHSSASGSVENRLQ